MLGGDLNQCTRGIALVIAHLSGQIPSCTLLVCVTANYTWMLDACLWTLFYFPPCLQLSSGLLTEANNGAAMEKKTPKTQQHPVIKIISLLCT